MSPQSHHRTPSQQQPLSVEAMFSQIMTAVQKSVRRPHPLFLTAQNNAAIPER